ncbi:hypothetical protein OB894_12605 [Bacillus subtilis]|uniref:hypothetical protein n=1 Tax=Bacillus subtilis TaxID=1423 RepID=UPI00352708CF
MQIKIKYLDETQTRISKIEQGDWIEFKLVPLGVAMELPEGYEAHVKRMPAVELIEVDHLGNDDRGGHGSTGTK